MEAQTDSTSESDRRSHSILSRHDSLWQLTASCESDTARFLLLSTAGGAVATVSFMGAAPELRSIIGPRIALCAFLLGVAVCGLMLLIRAVTVSSAYCKFLEDVAKFRRNDISWDELADRSSPKYGSIPIKILACVTYACLISGLVAGALTVWTRK